MKTTTPSSNRYAFERKWTPKLKADGFVSISKFFLKNYHRLKPYDITHGEAMFIIHLMQYKWDHNAPFPAYKTIAQMMHVSPKSARRFAARLQDKKYLKREIRIGDTNRFHLDGLMTALDNLKSSEAASKSKKATRSTI